MLIGWRVFRYSTEPHRNNGRLCSACIAEYSQSVFTNEPTGLSIYTTASKTIEVLVGDGTIEMRLLLWSECATRGMILERVNAAVSVLRTREREVEVAGPEGVFSLSFYKEDEASQFVSVCVDGPLSMAGSTRYDRVSRDGISGVSGRIRLVNEDSGHGRITAHRFVTAMKEKSNGYYLP